MARRPKRSLATELLAHRQLAQAAHDTCAALVTLEPEVAGFFFARQVLADAVTEFDRKLKALEAEAQPGEATTV